MASNNLRIEMNVTTTGSVKAAAINSNDAYTLPTVAGGAEGHVLRYVSGTTTEWSAPGSSYTIRNDAGASVTVAATDEYVVCTRVGAKTVTLPAAEDGKRRVVVYNAGTGTATVGAAGGTVGGAASFPIQDQSNSMTFVANPDLNDWILT